MNNQNIKLEVNVDEVNLILTALLEVPAKFSMDVINKLRTQALPQLKEVSEEQETDS